MRCVSRQVDASNDRCSPPASVWTNTRSLMSSGWPDTLTSRNDWSSYTSRIDGGRASVGVRLGVVVACDVAVALGGTVDVALGRPVGAGAGVSVAASGVSTGVLAAATSAPPSAIAHSPASTGQVASGASPSA